MAAKNALLVFIKTPKQNFVKTRLATHLQPDEILSVYTAFLKDIDTHYKNLSDIDLWYVISPENLDLKVLSEHIDLRNYFIQKGTDLGERMCHALDYSSELNYSKSILIGSDIPDISTGQISDALRSLEDTDCVLGPTLDGGYYLIGMKKCYPELFRNIDWSTDKVMDQTLSQAKNSNLNLSILKPLDDIDTYNDLQKLHKRLKQTYDKSIHFPENLWDTLNQIFVNR